MRQFNHHMLSLARDVRELTQTNLAQKMRLVQGTLSKYEMGLLAPPEDVVVRVADVLQFPESFFYQPEQPYGFPPFHFRKRKKLGAKALSRIIAEMNLRRMHVKRLSVSCERGTTGAIPELDPDEYRGISDRLPSIEHIAQHVREAWGVPRGPIDNMVSLIERNGGIVVPCEFGTNLIDAMSQRIDGMPVMFFVNKSAPADRIRYTLAHELGHMVLHTRGLNDDSAMEEEADEFAGAFLLPASEVRPQLRRFDLPHLANLKAYWKVSMAAIAMRASRLHLITPYQERNFWVQMSKANYGTREPNEPKPEPAETMASMIQFHRRQLGYSDGDLAELLHLIPSEFQRLYGQEIAPQVSGGGPLLRLVK